MAAGGPDEVSVSAAELRAAVELAELTYRSVTEMRRRFAAILLVAAIALGVLALVLGGLWLQTRQEAAAVEDRALVAVMGVEIPDPRPAFERAALNVRALILGVAGAGFGVAAGATLGLWALVRPSGPSPSALTSRRSRQNPSDQDRSSQNS